MEIPTFILEAAGQDPAFDGIFPEQAGSLGFPDLNSFSRATREEPFSIGGKPHRTDDVIVGVQLKNRFVLPDYLLLQGCAPKERAWPS